MEGITISFDEIHHVQDTVWTQGLPCAKFCQLCIKSIESAYVCKHLNKTAQTHQMALQLKVVTSSDLHSEALNCIISSLSSNSDLVSVILRVRKKLGIFSSVKK